MQTTAKTLAALATFILLAATAALAQPNTSDSLQNRSDLPPAVAQNFESSGGFTVDAAVQQTGGSFRNAEVYVLGTTEDRFFKWWVGQGPDENYVIYDPYNNVWWRAPVRYVRAEIRFQGETREGFYRGFGCKGNANDRYSSKNLGCEFVDPFHFFGMDGHVYRKINVFRYVGRPGSGPQGGKRRIRVARYFLDLKTGERSVEPRRAPPGLVKRAERLALRRLELGPEDPEDYGTWKDTYEAVKDEERQKEAPEIDRDGPEEEEQEHIEQLERQVRGEE